MRASDGCFVTALAVSTGASAADMPDSSGVGVWMAESISSSDHASRFQGSSSRREKVTSVRSITASRPVFEQPLILLAKLS